MIDNWECPYCGVEMVEAENLDRSRSVEHFIPNALLSIRRSPRDGDFFACRRCNSKKSKIDHVLAVVARTQSPDADLAADALAEAVTSSKKSSAKFVRMLRTAREAPDGMHMTIPIDGRDLFDYLTFLAKGQHFRHTGKVFDPRETVALIQFANKQVMTAYKTRYRIDHWSDPIVDLTSNPNSEACGRDECVIWSREHNYLFVLHHFTAVMIQVLPVSRKNRTQARSLERRMLVDFSARSRNPRR